jgi:hypothetical protein
MGNDEAADNKKYIDACEAEIAQGLDYGILPTHGVVVRDSMMQENQQRSDTTQ